MELPLDGQIRIQDRGGTGITHSNWEVYHKLRDEGSVWFIITRVQQVNHLRLQNDDCAQPS